RESTDGEKANEPERVKHWRVVRDRALVKSGRPVKDFHGGRNRDKVAQKRERDGGVGRFAGDEHVMRPNDETNHGDADTGRGNETITKNRLSNERGNDFADYTHGRKDHDVHSWVRIKPKEMLEENWVAAISRIEEAEVEHALEAGEKQGNRDNRCAKYHDQTGGGMRPDEDGQAEPGHAQRTHGLNGNQKIQAGENRGKSVYKDADDGGSDGGIRIDAAKRCVKGPAGVEAARSKRIQYETAANEVDIPAQEIDFREGEVF